MIGRDQVKVQPSNTDNYRKIVKALEEKSTAFHTFQLKEDRKFR